MRDDVRITELGADDLPRIAEVDRAEVVHAEYRARPSRDGRGLTLERVELRPPFRIPSWSRRDVEVRVREWKPRVEAGGLFAAGLRGTDLVAFVLLGPSRLETVELCALFVDRRYRRASLGSRLMDHAVEVARGRGARSLWLASNRTASAVEFYLKHGCEAISLNRNDLVPHRSGDPVLAKPLTPG